MSHIQQINHFPFGTPPYIYHYDYFNCYCNPKHVNSHTDIELLLCTTGNGRVHCDGRAVPFETGDLVVINSGVMHRVETNNPFNIKYHCMIIDNEFCKANSIPVEQLLFKDHLRDQTASALYLDAVDAFKTTDDYRTARCRIACAKLLLHLCEHHRFGSVMDFKPDPALERTKTAIRYIRANIHHPIGVAELADEVGLSPSYFSKEFKRITGETVVNYINLLRCRMARNLMLDGAKVSTAANAVGFENMSYFTKTFKKYYDELPSEVGKNDYRN